MQVVGVTESAVQYLREKIITGELKPGQRLNEVELSEELGISRPPLREALRTLTKDYLVQGIPRRGTFVTPLSIEDLKDIYSARTMVETHSIQVIGENRIRQVDSLRDSVKNSQELLTTSPQDAGGWLKYWKAFSDFHYKLVEMAQNMFLYRFYKVIGYNLARYQVLYLRLPGSNSESVHTHLDIVNLLEKGSCEQAKAILVMHLDRTYQALEESIKNLDELQGQTTPA
ncbi:MAG: GntR family transcriptional regulator [Desulfarculaceae bacterium]|nr:GntR family transcriptional regulator [Desulfarculaceae bacterium]MCF8072433.1 GntR family transcriptional regulator [Desulfarculaceae bacterium]MCF8102894.1 GntR family transcriptional regulator [Desulfarculaceae bacterium]MCF8118476.1 GntR family transcriptional regulator [Desulfarculaceae bacterium]